MHAAANLTATAASETCTKAPSPRQGVDNVTVLQPGPGQCGVDGFVDQGRYTLSQVAPAGTTFSGWECFDISTGSPVLISLIFPVVLSNQSVSCVAVYNYTAPSPSPRYVHLALLLCCSLAGLLCKKILCAVMLRVLCCVLDCAMLCWTMLWCGVLCCAVLCQALCCARCRAVCCDVLCDAVLCDAVLCSAVPCCALLCCAVPGTVLC
jgi:hypothetical protein